MSEPSSTTTGYSYPLLMGSENEHVFYHSAANMDTVREEWIGSLVQSSGFKYDDVNYRCFPANKVVIISLRALVSPSTLYMQKDGYMLPFISFW